MFQVQGMSRIALGVALVVLPCRSAWSAEPPPRTSQQPAGRAPSDKQQPVPTQFNPSINDAAMSMQRAGGSLLKAQLNTLPPQQPDARTRHEVSFYAIPEPEPKTIKKHDLLTIVVREESESSSQASTDTKRDSQIQGSLDEFIKLRLKNWEVEGAGIGPTPPSVKASGTRNFKGEGTVDRSDSLTARITSEVVDVKPNGTLVLQARKTIKTDEEEQQFVLTGTCRVEDIVADNTVLSTQLYDLRIEKNHKGAVRSATQRSWLAKILDAISPF